jgi:hypothetical protein
MLTKVQGQGERRILHKLKIDEISGVDRPAQVGAKVVLLKRDEGNDVAKAAFLDALRGLQIEQRVRDALQDMWTLNDALCMSIRTIIENPDEYPDPVSAVRASLSEFAEVITEMVRQAVGEVEDEVDDSLSKFTAEDYAYVPDPEEPSTWRLRLTKSAGGPPDARILGAVIAALGPGFGGVSFDIPQGDRVDVVKRVRSAWRRAYPKMKKSDLPEVLNITEEEDTPMTKNELKAPTAEELQVNLQKKEEELKISKAYGELSDAEKAYYAKLDEKGKTDFLTATPEVRKSEITRASEDNGVVYTSPSGETFRKNDDPRLVQMAKDRDEDRKIAKQEREKREDVELKKRAAEELQYLPGDEATKVAMLKAIDAIPDATQRTAAQASLKSQNETMEKAFKTVGSSLTVTGGPASQLESIAKRISTDEKISFADAYLKACQTAEGKALYEQTIVK